MDEENVNPVNPLRTILLENHSRELFYHHEKQMQCNGRRGKSETLKLKIPSGDGSSTRRKLGSVTN
jgi:hypothetical protein